MSKGTASGPSWASRVSKQENDEDECDGHGSYVVDGAGVGRRDKDAEDKLRRCLEKTDIHEESEGYAADAKCVVVVDTNALIHGVDLSFGFILQEYRREMREMGRIVSSAEGGEVVAVTVPEVIKEIKDETVRRRLNALQVRTATKLMNSNVEVTNNMLGWRDVYLRMLF